MHLIRKAAVLIAALLAIGAAMAIKAVWINTSGPGNARARARHISQMSLFAIAEMTFMRMATEVAVAITAEMVTVAQLLAFEVVGQLSIELFDVHVETLTLVIDPNLCS